SAYDKDLQMDDRLGVSTTDRNGNFRIIYRRQSFEDSPGERLPDLYLKVLNSHGKVIYNSKKQVRFQASQNEYFEIKIKTNVEIKLKPKITKPDKNKKILPVNKFFIADKIKK
ncbi:hypothetical protein ACFLQ1_02115, partial [Candidatus Auribacterota bacterium]